MTTPDGYRIVEQAEPLQRGDLCYDYTKGQWVAIQDLFVQFVNATGLKGTNNVYARRR